MYYASVEHRLLGTVEIAETAAAQKNFEGLARHMAAEEAGDLEITMATMAPEPFWINHGTQTYLHGRDAVRTRYANRFRDQPGMNVDIRRTVVTDSVAVLQGYRHQPGEKNPKIPLLLLVEFDAGKVAGETSYSNPAEEPER